MLPILVSNLMFDEKARKMQHNQTEKGIKQENANHMTCMANPLNTKQKKDRVNQH